MRPAALGLVLAALVAWAYAPYFGGTLVGAGDAYHYALQVADTVTQARSGHFPLFVGGTVYGFNGNIHTLRTAPYFDHAVVLLDLATRHRLGFAALLDGVIALHALMAAALAWLVASSISRKPALAAGLAALYVLAPAVVGSVETEDMVATFVTLPWLPVLLWGAVALLEREDPWPGAWAGSWALALIWWGHPAIAAWASVLWAAAWAVRFVRQLRLGRSWAVFLLTGGLLAAAIAYPFVSVQSLHLAYGLGDPAGTRSAIVHGSRALWPDFILPPSSGSSANLQPGFGLWLAAIVGCVGWRRSPAAGLLLFASAAALLLALGAIPPLTGAVWSLVPTPVLRATNIWPVQRLGPLLSAVLFALGALGLRRIADSRPAVRRAAAIVLAAAVAASALALAPIRKLARESTASAATTAQSLDPRNVELTRASYAMFGSFPPTFSNGRTAAPWELRLFEPGSAEVFRLDNATAVVAAAKARGDIPPAVSLTPTATLPVRPDLGYVLEFTFAHPEAAGEIEITGLGLARVYGLPSSGMAKAFGSAPGNSPLIGFLPSEHDGKAIVVTSTVPGVAVRAYPFAEADLPLRLESLLPLQIEARLDRPARLETPRVFVPGYAVTVDGRSAPLVVTTSGFVGVDLSPGDHRIEVNYLAPPPVRLAYKGSIAALALMALAGLLVIPPWSRFSAFHRGPNPVK